MVSGDWVARAVVAVVVLEEVGVGLAAGVD